MNKFASVSVVGISALALAACSGQEAAATGETANPITEEEVTAAQTAWGEGIVAIGAVFTEEGDYSARAAEHIATHYAYGDDATILFKPTLAAEDQFRETTEEALSYCKHIVNWIRKTKVILSKKEKEKKKHHDITIYNALRF